VFSACVASAVVASAAGQAVTFEFYPLRPLAGLDASSGVGINAKYTVVGWSRPANSGVRRATLWQLCGGSGVLGYSEGTDLAALAGIASNSSLDSEGFEINNDETAVGYVEIDVSGSPFRRGFVWDMGEAVYEDIAPFASGATGESHANSISDDTVPYVVGWATEEGDCFGQPLREIGFRMAWVGSSSTPSALPVDSTTETARGNDVATGDSGRTVGLRTECPLNSACDPSFEATEWTGGSTPSITSLNELGPDDGSQANATNDDGMACGYMRAEDFDCVTHAAFWPSTTGTVVNLSDASGYPLERTTEALGISEPSGNGVVLAVGRDSILLRGLLWIGSPAGPTLDWTYVYIDDLMPPLSAWTVSVAFDVTDDGWIVGEGGCGSVTRAIVMRPAPGGGFACPGDVNQDDDVGAADLSILLGAWGQDEPVCAVEIILCDMNMDGVVGVADLSIPLGEWGNSCSMCSSSMQSMQQSSEESETLDALAEALAALGFGSPLEFVEWGTTASLEQLATVGSGLAAVLDAKGGE